MAFVNRNNADSCSKAFVAKLSSGQYIKDSLTNHSPDFQGGGEVLARTAFSQFICSVSYVLMQIRRGTYVNEDYHGC